MARNWLVSDIEVNYQWMDLDKISSDVPLAFIASEDQLFLEHHGFDLKSLSKAIEDQQKGKRVRGASTISQQVAKNLFLYPSKSYVRKGFEAYFTVLIELLWPKERIMEVYVNIVELGEGIYGVPAATQKYFKKTPINLTKSEAALMATALPNPKIYSLEKPGNYMIQRQKWVKKQMYNLGGNTILLDWYE